jgi:outer membrane protein insertion porin family/translocation and assembly module TamA
MRGVRHPFLTVVLLVTLAAGCREEGDIQISDLTFNGVKQVQTSALTSVLQTKKGSRLPWGRKRFFDRRAFEADLKRIEAFYRDRGFPDARVSSFDVKLNDTQDKVAVTVNISEGEPILVAGFRLEGFDVLPPRDRDSIADTLPLRKDQPLDRQLEVASRERAANVLKDKGYPYAEVTLTEEDAGTRRKTIVLMAAPGALAHFGPIEIVGQSSVNENIIRRQVLFDTGDVFTRKSMRDTQRKIYSLELFEFANVESIEDKDLMIEEVPVRITVAEGKHRKVNLGIGYGSEEKARARIRWDHLNTFGGAQKLGVEAKWSSLDRGIKTDYTEPFFIGPQYSLRFEGQGWQAAEPVYTLDQLGGRIMLRHQVVPENVWSVSLIDEYQRSSIADIALQDFTVRDDLIALGLDPRTGESEGTLSAIAFDLGRVTATNLLDARQGYAVDLHLEQAGKWLWGTFNYYSLTAAGRHYQPIGRRLVFANRLRFGAIDPSGADSNVPFYKRFFLGGAGSVRGWGRYEISPLSGFGFPIGGYSMLEGSSEVRMPLAGKLGAVAFLDYGNVWARPWDINVGDLRYAVGPGLRYLTPIGPVRVDVGFQLNPISGLLVDGEPQPRPWRLHFSIGQAF